MVQSESVSIVSVDSIYFLSLIVYKECISSTDWLLIFLIPKLQMEIRFIYTTERYMFIMLIGLYSNKSPSNISFVSIYFIFYNLCAQW